MVVVAVFLTPALGRIDRLVDRNDNVSHRNFFRVTSEAVTTAGAAHAVHQRTAPQLAEQLLQLRQSKYADVR